MREVLERCTTPPVFDCVSQLPRHVTGRHFRYDLRAIVRLNNRFPTDWTLAVMWGYDCQPIPTAARRTHTTELDLGPNRILQKSILGCRALQQTVLLTPLRVQAGALVDTHGRWMPT